MKPHIRRIYVLVEQVDADGSVTTYETDGRPVPGTAEARIIPHYQTRLHRRAGYVEPATVVDVTLFVDARLDHPTFRVTEGEPPQWSLPQFPEEQTYRIMEAPNG